MATISGSVIFDRDRSATVSSGDSGLANIPVVLQNVDTSARLTVLTDASGNYTFLNVPNGNYRIVESYGTPGGVPTPGDFSTAVAGNIPQGINPPISSAANPPPGSTNLDSVTPDTLLVAVTGSNLTNQNFLSGPVIYTPIQTILDPCAYISGDNLIDVADEGTFGTFPQGTPANTGAPVEPYPDVTPDFTYVLPNPAVYAPFGGEYTVQNIMNNSLSAEIGAWWRIADHTTGNETGRMMIVNGYNPGAVFFRDVVAVQPNTNYLFTSWILNLFKVNGYPNPELGVRVLDENGTVLYSATLGTEIPVNVNAPEWKQIGSVINSRGNTSLTIEFLSEGPEVIGNDYAIDDISFREIEVPEFTPVKTVDLPVASVGETVVYTVTLTNSCQSPLTNVSFQDTLPNGLSFVPGSVLIDGAAAPTADPGAGFALPDVPGGETVTVTFRALVDTIPLPNPALNSASIDYSYTPVEGGIPGDFSVISNEVPVQVGTLADVAVVKTASPSPVTAGEIITYTLLVSNAGPSTAVNTNLTDPLPGELENAEISTDGGVTWSPFNGAYFIGDLAPGSSQRILIRATVSATAAGQLVNTATVRSDTPDPNPDNNTSTVDTPVTPVISSADLSIVKTAAPDPVQIGGTLTYTLTISNAGPSTAQNVVLWDDIPAGLINPEFSLDGGLTWQPWTGSRSLGSLAAGGSITILIRGTVDSSVGSSLVNTAIVSSDTPDPNPDNNQDTNRTGIASSADLSVTKSARPSPVVPGELLTYTITVSNNGPTDAENVLLYDAVPPELTAVQVSVDGGVTWAVWSDPYLLGRLNAGQSRIILIRGTVEAGACGIISNTAVVTSDTVDPNPNNNTATADTPIRRGADLSIQKTAAPNPVSRCQRLTYTLTVTNSGPETASQVIISDSLPTELSRQMVSTDDGRRWRPWPGSYNAGDLPAGASITLLLSGIVSPCAGCAIANTAVVSSSTLDPNPANNTASVTVAVQNRPCCEGALDECKG